jgi:hypothetical protein
MFRIALNKEEETDVSFQELQMISELLGKKKNSAYIRLKNTFSIVKAKKN